jgi:hypothetical protein
MIGGLGYAFVILFDFLSRAIEYIVVSTIVVSRLGTVAKM